MTNQTIKLSMAVVGLCLVTVTAQAQTVTLLDENFDAGMPGSAQTLGGGSVNLRSGNDSINTYNAGNPNQRFSTAAG